MRLQLFIINQLSDYYTQNMNVSIEISNCIPVPLTSESISIFSRGAILQWMHMQYPFDAIQRTQNPISPETVTRNPIPLLTAASSSRRWRKKLDHVLNKVRNQGWDWINDGGLKKNAKSVQIDLLRLSILKMLVVSPKTFFGPKEIIERLTKRERYARR